MLLGVIVRSKVVFKRPLYSVSGPYHYHQSAEISSASVEVDSPASKRSILSELPDSSSADIDDIVFQYNTSQAKITGKESEDSSVKTSPASETSTPSVASSAAAMIAPAVSANKSSVPSLEAHKQQLLDLQERARQYILAQTQGKGTAVEESQGTSEKKPESSDTANVNQQGGEAGGMDDDDSPYDPEEGLDLDLNTTHPTPPKPAVTAAPEEPAKPSSLEMLVSTLQRLQGASSHLSALSAVLPQGAMATTRVGPKQPSGTTSSAAASSPSSTVGSAISPGCGLQSVALATATSCSVQPRVSFP